MGKVGKEKTTVKEERGGKRKGKKGDVARGKKIKDQGLVERGIFQKKHAEVNYSQTDTLIHLPPPLSLEKTTRVLYR